MDQALNDTGWRGSQEGWLEAAYHSLLDSGVDSVKILPLAKKLNLSRTSFYWFFKDREELLAGLVARWRDKNTGNIVKQSEAYAESLAEAMLNVFDCWLNNDLFDARFEFAVRSWALQSDGFSPRSGKPTSFGLMRSSACLSASGYQKRHRMSEREQLTSCRSDTSPCKPRRNSPSA